MAIRNGRDIHADNNDTIYTSFKRLSVHYMPTFCRRNRANFLIFRKIHENDGGKIRPRPLGYLERLLDLRGSPIHEGLGRGWLGKHKVARSTRAGPLAASP